MEEIRIKQPKGFSEIDGSSLLNRYTQNRAAIHSYVARISEDKYRFWSKAQHKEPAEGFTKVESWYLAREVRKISSRSIPVKTPDGTNFTWLRLMYTDELLREIDMYAGGNFLVQSQTDAESTQKQKYLTRGIMEEAIASSQLEGADTSRKYAKRMIAENIKPRNSSDQMILNNFKTLSRIDEEYKDSNLSQELLLDMHTQLTKNTFEDGNDDVGRFRNDADEIVVKYEGKIAHIPPNEEVLKRELDRLIDYANDTTRFVHPVIKAIVLHFWIGYLHPFVDGNGRIARAIFYWYMLKNNYWAIVYLPISLIIKRAPARYTYSYIFTEQDNLDFTYFYDYNIKQIIKAIHEFKDYASKVSHENAEVNEKLKNSYKINDRQKQLVHYIIADKENHITITSHQKLNGVSRQTAHRDISGLEKNGLLLPEKNGRNVRYYASNKLIALVHTA